MPVIMDAAAARTPVDWTIYARCSNCAAPEGEPCTGREARGSYATKDYHVHIGELSAPHARMTIVEREEWWATWRAYVATMFATVAEFIAERGYDASVVGETGTNFYRLTAGRYTALLPACVCEVDQSTGRTGVCARLGTGDVGAALTHGGACDGGERPCHGWHTARIIALVERVCAPAKIVTPRKPSRPKAPKSDPTPEQVAAIMAKHGLNPAGEPLD